MYKMLQDLCKERGTNITKLCESVTGSSGNLSTWKKGYMRSDYLSKVADYLDCSVDYLLGRVDTPNGTYSIKGDNNVQINGNSGNHSTFTINNSEQPNRDKLKEDFMKVFDTLDFNDKIEVMQFAVNKTKK